MYTDYEMMNTGNYPSCTYAITNSEMIRAVPWNDGKKSTLVRLTPAGLVAPELPAELNPIFPSPIMPALNL